MDRISARVDAARDAALARMHDEQDHAESVATEAFRRALRVADAPENLVGHFEDRAEPWCDVILPSGWSLDMRVADILVLALRGSATDEALAGTVRALAAELADVIAADLEPQVEADFAGERQ